MRILLTNDDGIHAEGLRFLIEIARRLGTVKVVAPDRERSACGHSMTLRDPLRCKRMDIADIEAYSVNGVPVDCVNVGLTVAWPDGCDLILSGINNGPNLGFDVTYSGTVAGAMEGAINGIWSMAISMAVFVEGAPYHYETAVRWFAENVEWLMKLPAKERTFLNINIPAIAFEELNGWELVGMGRRVYEDRVEERFDPWGRQYFWQGGVVVMKSEEPNTDVNAVTRGKVAITPVSLDWTDHEYIRQFRKAGQ